MNPHTHVSVLSTGGVGVAAALKANAVQDHGPTIKDEIESLSGWIREVSQSLSVLEDRLTPVLEDSPTTKSDGSKCPTPGSNPMSRALRSQTEELRQINARLHDLLNRIGL